MFRIDTIKPYPEDYKETTVVAKQELHSNARPELLNHVVDMDAYKVVFLGYRSFHNRHLFQGIVAIHPR
jgi:hypothetical protein